MDIINNSFISVKSITEKKINEDFVTSFKNEKLNIQGVILGDGIGSHYKPDIGSKFCSLKLKDILENCNSIEDISFEKYFIQIQKELKNQFEIDEDKSETLELKSVYGTTLICAIEYDDKFVVAYLGNGSIWHLRGNFHTLVSNQRYLPWCSLNYLNPHSVEENGKEALYKFIALEVSEAQIKPSVIEITKDNSLFGDILIIGTDGLDSNDQTPIGKDSDGGIWISGSKKMELLYHSLIKFAEQKELNNDLLDEIIDEYSNDIKKQKLIDDDTSFGIIYSKKAIIYQQNLNESNTSK